MFHLFSSVDKFWVKGAAIFYVMRICWGVSNESSVNIKFVYYQKFLSK